jgi:hypothetical protein
MTSKVQAQEKKELDKIEATQSLPESFRIISAK